MKVTFIPVPEGLVALRHWIFSDECSDAVTISAEGFVKAIPGKMLTSTTKRLSVP